MSEKMRAMVLEAPGQRLHETELPVPEPARGQILLSVRCCGVCRTDLHVAEGDLKQPKLPLVLGHQIVGTVARIGATVVGYKLGQRVGVPWLGSTCGTCRYCECGAENLCDEARFTGYQIDGGFAQYARVDARFALPLPGSYPDRQVAPLLCAGLIGYRALSMAGDPEHVGLYGFGASAHIIAQVAKHQARTVYAFTRPGDAKGKAFALELGADWAGGSDEAPPQQLDAAIVFAPVGALVPIALRAVAKGGVVVCAGIHMSDIPSFPYELLWGERVLRSVANLTRQDGVEFLELAPKIPIRTEVNAFDLQQANEALAAVKLGRVSGAIVLTV